MRSLRWPLPSVVAGSLRSTLAKAAGRDFSRETALELLQVEVAGLFPAADGQIFLPAPNDCLVHSTRGPLRTAPHSPAHGGCDLPAGLLPVGLTEEQAADDFKPEEGPAWWPCDRYAAWLAGEPVTFDARFLRAPEVDLRTHVHLDPGTGAAEDGNLFTTAALPLSHLARYGLRPEATISERLAPVTLVARARAQQWCAEAASKLDTLHPLGGERRLVHWRAGAPAAAWSCPDTVRSRLATATRVRMVLATPAVFGDGWKPRWLDRELTGTPPGANVTLRLVGVAIQRWQAVSGWSLANLSGQPRGPKPIKRYVPAGGVYFYETIGQSTADLADRWLESVADDEQDRRDGFGLAAWGVW